VKLLSLTLTVAVIAAVAPQLAAADGDPASDYLLGQSVFLPFDAKIPSAKAKELTELVTAANHSGFRIRVAVIATRYDLGSVTALWLKPQKYAEFLGAEIYFVYRDRLLVAMANGYGYSKGGKPLPPGPLAKLPTPGPQATALVTSASTAVQRLAAASGVHLDLPHPSGNNQTTRDRIIIIAVALTAVALVGAWILLRRLRRARST
jgi:hypothetical protein